MQYPLATLTGLSLGANLGQGNPNNYQLSTVGSSIVVTKIPIIVTGDTSGSVQKTYDGSTAWRPIIPSPIQLKL